MDKTNPAVEWSLVLDSVSSRPPRSDTRLETWQIQNRSIEFPYPRGPFVELPVLTGPLKTTVSFGCKWTLDMHYRRGGYSLAWDRYGWVSGRVKLFLVRREWTVGDSNTYMLRLWIIAVQNSGSDCSEMERRSCLLRNRTHSAQASPWLCIYDPDNRSSLGDVCSDFCFPHHWLSVLTGLVVQSAKHLGISARIEWSW